MRSRPDPRLYQIGALSALLAYGSGRLEFDVSAGRVAIILGVALGAQWLGARLARSAFEAKSTLISGLSLCLLLRTNSDALAAGAGALAIGGKFFLRWRGKHLFNPTNFALVALLLLADGQVWVSPGQWGSVAFFGFAMVCVGGLVATRAARADVALGFLAVYLALGFGRSAWLGEPLAIPWHRTQSGALLLFTFFMISDPRTTPDSRAGRLVFAALVAFGAWYVQFRMFRTNGLLWSLALGAFAVPLLDWLLPGPRYRWARPGASSSDDVPLSSQAALHPARPPAVPYEIQPALR